jgi:hypothetical protein
MPYTDTPVWIDRVENLRKCSTDEATERVADVVAIIHGQRPIHWEQYFKNVDQFVALSS